MNEQQQSIEALQHKIAALEAKLASATPEDHWQSILDGMFEGIQILDFDYRYVYVNKTAAIHSRISREELIGKRMVDMYPGIDTTEVFGLIQRCMVERTPQQMINHFTYPDGKTGWFDLRISPNQAGILILSVDISAHKLVEEQLRKNQEQLFHSQKMEAVGQLAGGIAHDFNNLLMVINGYCQTLLEELAQHPDQKEQVQEILTAGTRAAALTHQLLAFSRKQVLEPRVLNLNETVHNMEKMLRRLIGEDIELEAKLDPNLGDTMVDPGQLEQVVMNLAVNARDAMPKGGRLTIETKNAYLDEAYAMTHPEVTPGSHVLISVSDNGTGMTEEVRSRIFEPFFSTKAAGKGTGLGLATAHGIVKQSGGHIWVYSELGKGTVFKVYFPRVDEKAEKRDTDKITEEMPMGTETILLVEDEEGVRKLVSRTLRKKGYTVLEATNGEDALVVAGKHDSTIQLVLSDVVMPKMSGPDLAQKFHETRPATKFVFMSGYTEHAIIRHGMIDGGIAFLNKPCPPDELLKKIREVLGA